MKILITGASSYVGAKLYVDLKEKHDVTGTYFSNQLFPDLLKLDITNKDEVFSFITTKSPAIIIHVAANASGSWCEKNPDKAENINNTGTKNIVAAAKQVSAKIIFISSFAAINPTTVYGKTKLAGEQYVQKSGLQYCILRPSLIFGYSLNTKNDRPFNRLLRNLEGKPAVYDDSWEFQPTWLKHLSHVTEQVIKQELYNEILLVAVDKMVTQFEIAHDILSSFNIQVVAKGERKHYEKEDLSSLDKLHLPTYSYDEMIQGIIEEIKEHTN